MERGLGTPSSSHVIAIDVLMSAYFLRFEELIQVHDMKHDDERIHKYS